MYSLSQIKAPNNVLCQKSILRVFLQGLENLTTKLNKLKRMDTKKIIIERKWSDLKTNKLILNTIDLNNIPQFKHTLKYSGIERWPFNKYLCPPSIKSDRIYLKIITNNLIYSIYLLCIIRLASPQSYKILPTRTMSCSSFTFSSVLGTYWGYKECLLFHYWRY